MTTTLVAILAVIAAIVAVFPFGRIGLAFVFLSLFVYTMWGAGESTLGATAFWILFIFALGYTLFAGYTRRRGAGVGLAMLLFTIVLVSDWTWTAPFDGWGSTLITLLVVIGTVLLAILLIGLLIPVILVAAVAALVFVGAGGIAGLFGGDIEMPWANSTPPTVTPTSPPPAVPPTTDEPTTDVTTTDTPTTEPTESTPSAPLENTEVPDHIKGSAPPTSEEYWQPDMPTWDDNQDHTGIPEED